MKKIFFLFLLSFYVLSFGQQTKIDSLKTVFKHEKNQDKRLAILDKLTKLLRENGDKAHEEVLYYTQMLNQSGQLHDYINQAKAAKFLATYYLRKEDFKQAEEYASQSKNIALQSHDNPSLMKAYRQLGLIYNHFDMYPKAIKNYRSALTIFNQKLTPKEQESEKEMLGIIYASLSTVYRNVHQDSLAVVYDLKSIDRANKTNDYMRKSLFYVKVGWTYVLLEQYKLAAHNFKLALKDSVKIKVKVYNISAHHGLGYAYYKWKKYDKALQHDSISLAFFRKTDNRIFIQALLNNMADIFVEKHQLSKAIQVNTEAADIANEINNRRAIGNTQLTFAEIAIAQNNYPKAKKNLNKLLFSPIRYSLKKAGRVRLYGLLADIAEKEGNVTQAFHFYKLKNQVNDSLVKYKLSNVSRLDLKYQIEKTKKELVTQQQTLTQKELDKQKLLTVNVFLGFVLLIIIALLFQYYKKHQRNKVALNMMIAEVNNIQKELFKAKELFSNDEKEYDVKNFHKYLMQKYHIDKHELIDVWQSIALGKSRKEYAEKNKINENTVKTWITELYKHLKSFSAEMSNKKRYSDANAVKEYYRSLRWYESASKKK